MVKQNFMNEVSLATWYVYCFFFYTFFFIIIGENYKGKSQGLQDLAAPLQRMILLIVNTHFFLLSTITVDHSSDLLTV